MNTRYLVTQIYLANIRSLHHIEYHKTHLSSSSVASSLPVLSFTQIFYSCIHQKSQIFHARDLFFGIKVYANRHNREQLLCQLLGLRQK